jgi:hypothetical protein
LKKKRRMKRLKESLNRSRRKRRTCCTNRNYRKNRSRAAPSLSSLIPSSLTKDNLLIQIMLKVLPVKLITTQPAQLLLKLREVARFHN